MRSSEIKQWKSDFDRDGFVIIRGFVSPATLTELQERAQSAVLRLGSKDSADKKHGLPQLHGNVAKGLERVDNYFKELIDDGSHVALLTVLLDEAPTPATVGYFCKERAKDEIPPHRDGNNGLTIWFALDSASPDNGCVHFLKGSHLWNRDDGRLSNSAKFHEFSTAPSAVAAILDPGDVSVHNSKTIHWSGQNKSGQPRRAVNCFYQKNVKPVVKKRRSLQ